jgi:hypothetical protein
MRRQLAAAALAALGCLGEVTEQPDPFAGWELVHTLDFTTGNVPACVSVESTRSDLRVACGAGPVARCDDIQAQPIDVYARAPSDGDWTGLQLKPCEAP